MTFSRRLKANFLISTLLPFTIISVLISAFYNTMYERNLLSLTNNYITAIARNIDVYFSELEQITFSPYYNQDVIFYLNKLHRDKSLGFVERSSAVSKIQDLLSFLRYSRDDIQSLVLTTETDCLYYTTSMLNASIVDPFRFVQEKWYQQSFDAQGQAIFVPMHIQSYFQPQGKERVFSLARAIVDINTRETIAVIKIDANNRVLERILNDTTFTVTGNVYLTDQDGNIIYSKEGAIAPSTLLQPATSNDISIYADANYQQMVRPLQNGWSLHVLLDKHELRKNTVVIFIVAGLLYFAGTLLSFCFYNRSSHRLIAVISGIKNSLLAFEQGDFAVRCQGDAAQEFSALSDSINHMIVEFEKNIQQEYISTIRRKDAELRALQSQIEPHFLFNTLNNLIALSQDPTPREQLLLEESLFSLSYLLRYALDRREEVELMCEFQMLENYCKLQALRFGERFTYSISNKTNGHWGIPRLGIQPFVENAIVHGIEPMERPCHLQVSAEYYTADDSLLISIVDNGRGTDKSILDSNSIGITNSLERFRIYYPESKIQIVSRDGAGCAISITIPHPISIHLPPQEGRQ